MLAAVFNLSEAPSAAGNNLQAGSEPVVIPFSTDMFVSEKQRRHCGVSFWVGESVDPCAASECGTPRFRSYSRWSDYEGVKIVLSRGERTSRVTVHRTGAGSSPLYISTEGALLAMSWRMRDVVRHLRKPMPDLDACRRYLRSGPGPTRDQVIANVKILWPGESLEFDGSELTFECVSPAITLPSDLALTARITDAFMDQIRLCMERYRAFYPEEVMIELSGGLDSSCLAMVASKTYPRLKSYGLIQGGVMGVQQAGRRRELIDLFGLHDYEHRFADTSPFACLYDDDSSPSVYDDMYQTACLQAVERHPGGKPQMLLAGIGGDELSMTDTHLRDPGELPGFSSSSAIVGAVGRTGMFMKAGVWVRNPLISQNVVDLCRAIPANLRKDRMINVLALGRGGVSDGFLFPRYQEHYGNFVREAATRFDFDAALANSALLDLRVADPSKALLRARRAVGSVFDFELATQLYLLVKLEAVLRAYT